MLSEIYQLTLIRSISSCEIVALRYLNGSCHSSNKGATAGAGAAAGAAAAGVGIAIPLAALTEIKVSNDKISIIKQ